MNYVYAFVVGGLICACAQILIDKTKMTPARVVVGFVVLGVILTGLGIYEGFVEFAGAGATVPIIGFGYSLANGVKQAVEKDGFIGIFTGGLSATAAGIAAALAFSFLAGIATKSREK